MVAAKFFPVDDPDGSYPLCERDYFARLDLICGKCDKALRGSYITACSMYHVPLLRTARADQVASAAQTRNFTSSISLARSVPLSSDLKIPIMSTTTKSVSAECTDLNVDP